MEKWYQLNSKEVIDRFKTPNTGLSKNDVNSLMEKYGKNELAGTKAKSSLMLFLEQFKDFLVIILLIAATVSAVLGDIESSVVIFAVVTGNAILGAVQQKKAEKSLNSLKDMSTPTAKVIRDGSIQVISSKDVLPGDLLVVESGDFVCADGRIIESASLQINESQLTGESLSVEKTTDKIEGEASLGDRKNMAYSGSFVTYGRGKILVTETGMSTEVGKIASLLNSAKQKATPLQESLDKFGKKLAAAIIAICIVIFILRIYQGSPFSEAFMFAIALAVAAIPEALSSIVTIVLAFSTQKMVKENAIIRKLQAVEGLGSVSIICSDKTGTLTQNKMTVREYYANGKSFKSDQKENSSVFEKLMLSCVLCNDSTVKDGKEIGDPTETALIKFASDNGYNFEEIRSSYKRLGEVPFDSDRKLMSVAVKINESNFMITKGAPDVILKRTTSALTSSGETEITDDIINNILNQNTAFSSKGLRVLAFAIKEFPNNFDMSKISVSDENQLTFVGLTALMDPPREESKEAVALCNCYRHSQGNRYIRRGNEFS